MEERAQRRLAAIVSADVVGYSRLMQADEAGTHARLKARLERLVLPKVDAFGGRVVKLMGDGLLAEFPSVVSATEWALEMQAAVAEANRSEASGQRIEYRVGVNLGDVIIDGDDIYGDGVNVAARLQEIAAPGGVCLSDDTHRQVQGKISAAFADGGDVSLKNITGLVKVWHWPPDAVAERPAAGDRKVAPAQPSDDRPSIAVLPFDCYPVDAEQEAFANGMTEDLTTDLSKVSGLFVVARNSAQAFRGQSIDLRQVAAALGVRYLLEGSVRKMGERVRINAQLIDVDSGGHLWADRFDGTVRDVFELQDAVGAQVVNALAVELSQSEKASLHTVHTDNLDAYELFVRAKATPYPPIPPRIAAAREMFETVIGMAPDFAGGHAGAAAMTAFAGLFAHGDVSDAAERAEAMARHAITLDETFAWSYTALGIALLLQRKYDAAVAAARETISRQPNDADGFAYLGLITGVAGDPTEGARLVEEAIRLNPRFFAGPYWNILGQVQAFAGNHAAALEALETNLRQSGPVAPPAFCSRAVSYVALGDIDKAHAVVEELKAAFPQFRLAGWNLLDLFRCDEARIRYHDDAVAAGVPD